MPFRELQKLKEDEKTWMCAGRMFLKMEKKNAIKMLNKGMLLFIFFSCIILCCFFIIIALMEEYPFLWVSFFLPFKLNWLNLFRKI